MHTINTVVERISMMKNNHKWMAHLKSCEKQVEVPIKSLSSDMQKEIKEYYSHFGFKNVRTDWHRYIYSVSGVCIPTFLPEDFFHNILERSYNNKMMYCAWEDKAFMKFILNSVRFPETIYTNVNGYYFDKFGNMISKRTAKELMKKTGSVFAKPTIRSGGGNSALLIEDGDYEKIFTNLKKNYIVQEKIIQSKETATLNPSSVNTVKVVSFLFKGEVYILSAIMRVGAENAITDAAAGGKGYFLGINKDGTSTDYGMNVFGKRRYNDHLGSSLKGRSIPHYNEICTIIKKAHKHFPYFGFMSWDFCINEKNEVILIEYNTGYPVAMVYQMVNGPLLGDMTEIVLKDVRNRINHSVNSSL